MSLTARVRTLVRKLPVGRHGRALVRGLATQAFVASAYLRHGWKRRPGVTREGPVAVVGFHNTVLGLADGVRAFSGVLRSAGVEVVDWDISAVFGHAAELGGASAAPPAGQGPMVIHLNPRELVQLHGIYGSRPFGGRRVIGYWAWELETVPASWRRAFRYVDEVWTPSNFVAEAVRAAAPPDMPVRVFPHLVSLLPQGVPDRAKFGFPDHFTVLTSFDIRSGFVRKNPFAAIAAVRAAAAEAGVPITLACKVMGRSGAPQLLADLEAEAARSGDLILLTDWLSGRDMADLIASADAVISLHRSEGFGLLLAQGMQAGKPVVATGWSGNMDFMDAETARPVDYDLVPVADEQGLYAGGRWAEPRIEDAARKLASLARFPAEAQALGVRAKAAASDRLDAAKWADIAKVWLGR